MWAESADKTLREHADDRRREEIGFDPHIDKARNRGGSVVRVQMCSKQGGRSSEAWMAISAVSRSRISPIMMTSGSWRRRWRQACRKIEFDFGVHSHLRHTLQFVFNRILDRHDIDLSRINSGKRAVKSSRLPASRGPVTRTIPSLKLRAAETFEDRLAHADRPKAY